MLEALTIPFRWKAWFTCRIAHCIIKLTLRSRHQRKKHFPFCTWENWVPERGGRRSGRTNGRVKTPTPNRSVLYQPVPSSLSHTKSTLSSSGHLKPRSASPLTGVTWMFQIFHGFQMSEAKSILLPCFPLRLSPTFHSEYRDESCSFLLKRVSWSSSQDSSTGSNEVKRQDHMKWPTRLGE